MKVDFSRRLRRSTCCLCKERDMSAIGARDVKKLRDMTGCGMMDCKRALEEAEGDFEKAIEILRKKGIAKAAKKALRPTDQGMVTSYVHPGNRIGVLLEIKCETDFVARNEHFQQLAEDICLQIAAMKPMAVDRDSVPEEVVEKEKKILMEAEDLETKPEQVREKIVRGRLNKFFEQACLMEQPFIRNDKITIADHLKSVVGRLGENIRVSRFVRFELGEV